jgi:hypothetical protein
MSNEFVKVSLILSTMNCKLNSCIKYIKILLPSYRKLSMTVLEINGLYCDNYCSFWKSYSIHGFVLSVQVVCKLKTVELFLIFFVRFLQRLIHYSDSAPKNCNSYSIPSL